jgi:ATP-dependent protease ClpP protease subunit
MGRRGRTVRNVASAVHHTDTTDAPWDGGAAVRGMPNEADVLDYCHAWHEDNAGDTKGSYKFPHHETDGGPAFLAACRNGLARLNQADIPAGDRDGVRAHLQAHLDDGSDAAEDAGYPPVVARSFNRVKARVRALQANSVEQLLTPAKFWNVRPAAKADQADELWLYGEVGFVDWFTDEGLTASSFAKDLQGLKAKSLTLRVNSPGGDVFDGLAIKNMIASHAQDKGVKVTAHVDALAASIASVVIQAANEVVVEPHSQIMIHDASGLVVGNATEMREMAGLLDMISQNIATVYADAAGGTADEWRKIMKGEKWYTAQEAVDAGLADRMGDSGPKRKGKCTSCDGSGTVDGESCDTCGGTGRVKPSGPENVQPLRVAAQWCAKLFPGHEQSFENVLADVPVEIDKDDKPENGPTDPALPAPAASATDGTAAIPATTVPSAEAPAFTWDVSVLTSAVRAATEPPRIDLGDWRSCFAEAPAMTEPAAPGPVDLGPAPARPAPVPDVTRTPLSVGVDLGDWRTAFATAPAVAEPAAPGPVDLGPAPARPAPAPDPTRTPLPVGVNLGDWRSAFADMPELVTSAASGPVDLGPVPARPAPDPTPVRNPLAEAISAAVDITTKTQPEPDAPAASAPDLPEVPPIRLDVKDIQRAAREARY